MTKTKKLLIALLSVSCLTAGAIAFTACGENSADARDPQINAIYQQYVAYADANGEEVLSYEDWLALIKGEPGKDGTNGTNGTNGEDGKDGEDGKSAYELYLETLPEDQVPLSLEEWLASLKGADGTDGTNGTNGEAGVGIESVELSKDGTKLIVTYTDGTTSEIALHQHDYDVDGDGEDDVEIVIESTKDSVGLGYKTCKEDGHKELVVIPKLVYNVTVKLYDGTVVSGVNVSINGQTAVTGEDGSAEIIDFGKLGVYDVLLPKLDASYFYIGVKTTKTSNDVEVILYKAVPSTGISAEGKYVVPVEMVYNKWWGEYDVEIVSVDFVSADGNPVAYNVSIDKDSDGWFVEDEYSMYGSTDPLRIVADNGVSGVAYVSVDSYSVSPVDNEPVYVTIVVEKSKDVPVRGTQELPINLNYGENTNTVTANQETYVKYNNSDSSQFILEFGSNVTVTYIGTKVTGTSEIVVESGAAITNLNKWAAAYFKVISTDGNANIKVIDAPGTQRNPYTVSELGTVAGTTNSSTWYKYVATEDKTLTIEGDTNNNSLYVYDAEGYAANAELVYLSSGDKYSIDVKEGDIYYFKVSGYGDYSFVLREFNAKTDAGIITAPIELTVGTATAEYELGYTSLYFKITANADGVLGANPIVTAGAISYVNYYSDAAYKTLLNGRDVTSGEVVYIRVNTSYYGATFTLNPVITAADAKFDHVFTVKSGETALSGVTVKAMDGETVVATGVTAADGTVTLNMVPGRYSIVLEGLAANYKFNGFTTELPDDGSYDRGHKYEIAVDELVTYTVTLTFDGAPVSGATVSVLIPSSRYEDGTPASWRVSSTSAASGENGVITLSLVKGGDYRIQLGSADGYMYKDVSGNSYITITDDQTSITMALSEKVMSKLTGTHYFENQEYTFTVDVDGTYVLAMDRDGGGFGGITINGNNYPYLGYYSNTLTLNAGDVVVVKAYSADDTSFTIAQK